MLQISVVQQCPDDGDSSQTVQAGMENSVTEQHTDCIVYGCLEKEEFVGIL